MRGNDEKRHVQQRPQQVGAPQWQPCHRKIDNGFKGRVNVERPDSSGVSSLIFALNFGVIELMSVALSQHARGAVKIREIGALQRRRESCTEETGHREYKDQNKNRLSPGVDCRPASCVWRQHAAAVYRRWGRSATGSFYQASSAEA